MLPIGFEVWAGKGSITALEKDSKGESVCAGHYVHRPRRIGWPSTLPFLVLICSSRRNRCSSETGRLCLVANCGRLDHFLDRNTHVTTIAAFATVPFIFADTSFNANASIFASLAGALTVAALLALAAPLTAWLG